mmetsp:Transcript_9843/g.14507  ORF Transcript_9843/g.14507 Transcript_9843/m.14507 type:complete len:162 (+) Transcript_9843:32-517(+)
MEEINLDDTKEETTDSQSTDNNTEKKEHVVSSRARSTSAASTHQIQPDLPYIQNLRLKSSIQDLMEKTADVLESEMQNGYNDLILLQQMNKVTGQKYDNLSKKQNQVHEELMAMKHQYEQFQPYLRQLDEIETSVEQFSTMIGHLDEYTKDLEKQLMPYLK